MLPPPRALENVTVWDPPLTVTRTRPEMSYSGLWKSPTYLLFVTMDNEPV